MRIAYIGLGTMGSRMVANLLEAGHELAVHEVRRELADPTWSPAPAGPIARPRPRAGRS